MRTAGVDDVRLLLGRYLVLGLGFQLASDVLATAIAPRSTGIGQQRSVRTRRA